jgi:hypothetical protein
MLYRRTIVQKSTAEFTAGWNCSDYSSVLFWPLDQNLLRWQCSGLFIGVVLARSIETLESKYYYQNALGKLLLEITGENTVPHIFHDIGKLL